MKQAELIALAERCERAEGADRELDVAIARAVDWKPHGRSFTASAFTASLDAAMSLVPSGGFESWNRASGLARVIVFPEDGDDDTIETQGRGHRPALALTAACLRALAAMEPTDDQG